MDPYGNPYPLDPNSHTSQNNASRRRPQSGYDENTEPYSGQPETTNRGKGPSGPSRDDWPPRKNQYTDVALRPRTRDTETNPASDRGRTDRNRESDSRRWPDDLVTHTGKGERRRDLSRPRSSDARHRDSGRKVEPVGTGGGRRESSTARDRARGQSRDRGRDGGRSDRYEETREAHRRTDRSRSRPGLSHSKADGKKRDRDDSQERRRRRRERTDLEGERYRQSERETNAERSRRKKGDSQRSRDSDPTLKSIAQDTVTYLKGKWNS